MAGTRELAKVETAQGYQVGDYLVLRITGDKPSPCFVVDIEQSPIDIFPPQFVATWWIDPRVRCPQVITPYERVEAFAVANLGGKSVTLQTADGDREISVEEITEERAAAPATAGVSIADVIGPPQEAVGYSDDYDVGAAVKDAIGNLPRRGEHIPDWLAQYTVVEIGAEVGGIAGFNRLYARVRG